MRRLWAGAEADAIGWGGVARVARATGLAISTVRKGRDEIRSGARPEKINAKAEDFIERGLPVISVDTQPILRR